MKMPTPTLVYESTYKDISLAGIYEISKIVSSPQPLDRLLGAVIAVLSSFMQMRRGLILLLDAAGEPEIVASVGAASPKQGGLKTLVPQKAIDQVVATSIPLVIENIVTHAYFSGSAYRHILPSNTTVSFVAVPIKVDGAAKGILSIDREWNGKTSFRLDDDVRFLTMVANLVGQAVRTQMLVSRDRDRLINEAHQLAKELADAKAAPGPATPTRARAKTEAILGDSAVMGTLLERIEAAARSNATVLLRGETGTGKELFAQAIHDNSPRRKGPFVKVNCAALPESVIESELFGHEKGSFTGAINQRVGRFELAHNGTLFLDEIGEISASFQAKLLRVLQEGEFERVGGTKTIKVDARIVCATNRNLEDAVTKGQFRADLYYRINVVTLLLPPLRERQGDIPKLARFFLDRFSHENGRKTTISAKALEVMAHCSFPGNVRELENCVRRTAALAGGSEIVVNDLACQQGTCLSATLWKGHSSVATPAAVPAVHQPSPARSVKLPILSDPKGRPHDCPDSETCLAAQGSGSERERLVEAMDKAGWVQAKAARILGLTPRQIGYALRKYDIDIKRL